MKVWCLVLIVLAGASAACRRAESDGANARESAHGKPPNEVFLSREAVAAAGITLGIVERRSLGGGALIPAEVQFEPSSTAHVGPLVSGKIMRVAVGLGDSVRKGQLLGVVASSDVSAARARLEQAKARLSSAEATLKRQQQLATEGIGAQRALIDAEAQVAELRAEVSGLGRQLSVFGSGSAGELTLTAPIEGVVVAVHATLGETVTPDLAAFIVTDPTKVSVRGNVPELEISRIRSGSTVVVRIHSFPDLAMDGTITYVAPVVDERSRSLPIWVSIHAPDPRLLSGLFGSIELVGASPDERPLVVPVEAVATMDGQTVVFVPSGPVGAFTAVPVVIGRRAGGFFEIRSGPADGSRIASSGAFALKSALTRSALSDGNDR